jgi:aminoglycoside phosphotransferase family enzyme/predicted kinase
MVKDRQDLSRLVNAMSQPHFYPGHARNVELRQTHISYVFLTDDLVFKVKKPVRFSFLDYSTLQKRLQYCQEEVRLNRRLAPDVYLGVVPIRVFDGEFVLGDGGTSGAIVEYAVKMRRLDEERILDQLITKGLARTNEIRSIAETVARFHASSPSNRAAEYGGPSTIWERVEGNFKETKAFESITHSRQDREFLWKYSLDYFEVHKPLLEARMQQGRVREGHGDLRAEHVYVGPEGAVSIFDCVEFSESLRTCDGVSEIAFLAMDLDFLGAHDLARELVTTYAREASDPQVYELLPFYATYRALVRAKVEGLKSAEPEVPEDDRKTARLRAQRYFDLAFRYARGERPPAILVVCGLVGTGKSSLAHRLSDRTGFPTFNSDVVRKELAGLEPTNHARNAFEGGIYRQAVTDKTYAALRARAEETLATGQGVIIDATFSNPAHRELLKYSAETWNVPLLFIECTATEAEVRRRLEARAKRSGEVSDATWEVYQRQQEAYAPLLPNRDHLVVRTDQIIDDALHRIEDALSTA